MNRYLRKIIVPPVRLGLRAFVSLFDTVSTPDGHSYAVNPNIHPFDYYALRRGLYEKDERDLMRDAFFSDHTIIDIGANIGVVSAMAFEEKLQDGGRLICVEPNPTSLRALERNMRKAQQRRPSRAFEIVARAVTATDMDLAAFQQRDNLSSGLSTAVKPCKSDRAICVPTISLSKLLEKHAPNGASLICDAEGAEIELLEKAKDAFGKIRQIAIELHEPKLTGRNITPEQLAEKICALGFKNGGRAGNTFYFSRLTA